eukprot:Nk52_evm11s359 gene=Nk52_evmTU11s359
MSFVTIGTAFKVPQSQGTGWEAPSGSRSASGWAKRKQAIPITHQEAVDEKGRRRFHGAFTGGFSAGYFNTVGSKEGWTPSTFVSSRKAKKREDQEGPGKGRYPSARPEDFMDEEDFGEYGFAATNFVSKKEFETQEEASKREKDALLRVNSRGISSHNEAITNALVDSFGVPMQNNIAVQILQKMGWKPGQGIGAKRKRGKKRQENSCMEQYKDFLFAPEDKEVIEVKPKNDMHGLGYKRETLYDMTGTASGNGGGVDNVGMKGKVLMKDVLNKGKHASIKGFGVGVLDDSEYVDEDDPYGGDDMGKFQSFVVEDDDFEERTRFGKKVNQLQLGKGSQPRKTKRCWDGLLPLPGFVLSELIESVVLEVNNPKVPEEYVPRHPSSFLPSGPVIEAAEDISKPSITEQGIHELPVLPRESLGVGSDRKAIVSSILSSRFTSKGSVGTSEQKMVDVKAQERVSDNEATAERYLAPLKVSVQKWVPAPLLCKRLGIRNPYSRNETVGLDKTLERTVRKVADPIIDAVMGSSNVQQMPAGAAKKHVQAVEIADIEELEKKKEESEEGKAFLEEKRPPVDLFKAIFDNEDSSSEEEDDEKETGDEKEEEAAKNLLESSSETSKSSTPAKGAGQDLRGVESELFDGSGFSGSKVFAGNDVQSSEIQRTVQEKTEQSDENIMFGPVAPPPEILRASKEQAKLQSELRDSKKRKRKEKKEKKSSKKSRKEKKGKKKKTNKSKYYESDDESD